MINSPDLNDWKRANAWLFFVLAYGWSWGCWIPIARMGWSLAAPLAVALVVVGMAGPAVAGLYLTWLTGGRVGVREYGRRLFEGRRISGRWWVLLFLIAPVLAALAVFSAQYFGKGELGIIAKLTPLLLHPNTWLTVPLVLFLGSAVVEELGWRGYALDRLQTRGSALGASLILGVLWAGWYLPLFWIDGTYQQQRLGVDTPPFWLFLSALLPASVLITWVYNNTRRSILAAMLFHLIINLTAALISYAWFSPLNQLVWWLLAAIVITAIWGPETLVHRARKGALSVPTTLLAQVAADEDAQTPTPS